MRHTTQYLYNIDPKELTSMPYKEALQFKIDSAKNHIDELMKPHYSERDDVKINAVFDAIKFNTKLIEELECKH